MEDFFVGEIRYVAFDFAPKGWAICDGRLLPISQNTALFSLLGTQFGGNGLSTFALPDLRGRIAVGQGNALGRTPINTGDTGGDEGVELIVSEIPAHTHAVAASSAVGTTGDARQGVFAKPNLVRGGNLYASTPNAVADFDVVAPTGGAQPHENRAPGLAMTAIIALVGIYPQRPPGGAS